MELDGIDEQAPVGIHEHREEDEDDGADILNGAEASDVAGALGGGPGVPRAHLDDADLDDGPVGLDDDGLTGLLAAVVVARPVPFAAAVLAAGPRAAKLAPSCRRRPAHIHLMGGWVENMEFTMFMSKA